MRDNQRAAQVLFQQGTENEPDQKRRRLESQQSQPVPHAAEEQHQKNIQDRAVNAVDAEADQDQDNRIEQIERDCQQLDPYLDEGDVPDHQQNVADDEADHEPP